jgi:DNA polymerase-3 subunit delta'
LLVNVLMWRGIRGHDDVVDRFRRTFRSGRLASTYLFVGPEGIGKRRFARQLAQAVLCPRMLLDTLAPCDACESCRLFMAGNHPDFEAVEREADRSELRIHLFVGEKDHRNQEGLCHRLSLRPFLGGRRVAIIDDADDFNEESANCLLKMLEEPPPHSLLILIGTSALQQLPTVRSRSQVVSFRPLPPAELQQVLLDEQIAEDPAQAARLAQASGGSVGRARALAEPETWEIRRQMGEWLSGGRLDAERASRQISSYIDAVGKDSRARRERLRMVLELAIEQLSRPLRQTPQTAIADKLDDCLTALEYADRYANQATLLDWWLGRLA